MFKTKREASTAYTRMVNILKRTKYVESFRCKVDARLDKSGKRYHEYIIHARLIGGEDLFILCTDAPIEELTVQLRHVFKEHGIRNFKSILTEEEREEYERMKSLDWDTLYYWFTVIYCRYTEQKS